VLTIKCYYENGDTMTTGFNGSFASAEEYYLEKSFNLGIETDNIQKCVKIENVYPTLIKVVNPIRKKTYGGRGYNVFCKIKITNGKLSICGVEGPLPSGNCLGGCGQIVWHLKEEDPKKWIFNEGWERSLMYKFLVIWDRWHLNDMRAGTPKQEEFIREWEKTNRYDYKQVCEALKEAGLYEDNGYKYGHGWLTEELPQDVIEFLESLPETKNTYAWV
jgi:hypothetical protein